MADQQLEQQQEPHSLASTFPNPPPFWRDFTSDNVARIEELRKKETQRRKHAGGDLGGVVRLDGLPEELTSLQPPAEPSDGRWRVFGDHYMLDDKLPTLEEQGIENLPSSNLPTARDAKHYDRALELKRLAKSILLNFLELSGAMSRNPTDAEGKIQDLRTIFINIHHILNEYRPHQARESAIEMMQDHLDRTRKETMAIRSQVDKARRVLEGLGSLGVAGVGGGGGLDEIGLGGKTEEEKARERAMAREASVWATADGLFG